MSIDWSLVRLNEILQLQRRWLKLNPTEMYTEIGIRSFGKGIFHKTPVLGASLGNKRVLQIHPGDLVFNNVFAWEGAVAVAGKADEGKIGSHRFITYTPISDRCSLEYLRLFFCSQPGLEVLRRVSPGSAGRNRTLNIAQFAKQKIPLPPLEEQLRIVGQVEKLAGKIEEAQSLRQKASEETIIILSNADKDLFPPCNEKTTVGDFAKIQSGYAFKSQWFTDTGIRLVRNINIGHGNIKWEQVVRIPESRREEFERFKLFEGDILISLDRPLISTGVKVSYVSATDLPSFLVQRVGRVCFSSDLVLPEFFLAWLQSSQFIATIDPGRSNGVPHISQKEIERIPFSPPPLPEQRRIITYFNNLKVKVDQMKRLREEAIKELNALLPSILDKAFKGEL